LPSVLSVSSVVNSAGFGSSNPASGGPHNNLDFGMGLCCFVPIIMNGNAVASSHPPTGLTRRQFIQGTGAALISLAIPPLLAQLPNANASSVLIIGDSMSLCGFGQHLDKLFRSAGYGLVNTYMACGTNPLSWTTLNGFQSAKTKCGFSKIESRSGEAPLVFQDTYGMSRGHRPASYNVPKIEHLISACRPDILIVQLGNNLFDLLKGGNFAKMPSLLQPYLGQFLARVVCESSPVRRVYWVAPPVCERISKQSHDILVESIKTQNSDWLRVIDSRLLIPYPYRNLQPDRQHFFGPDMTTWADGVFQIIQQDISNSHLPPSAAPAPIQQLPPPPVPTEVKIEPSLIVWARLEKKVAPYTLEEIAPYHESLVAYVYRVLRIYQGHCSAKQILVLRPAHIDGAALPLSKFQPYQASKLHLIPVEETRWATLKAKENPGSEELDRFICEEDHNLLTGSL
jgi:hypothetical protein